MITGESYTKKYLKTIKKNSSQISYIVISRLRYIHIENDIQKMSQKQYDFINSPAEGNFSMLGLIVEPKNMLEYTL